jgi:site-specific recombinase XerD
MSAFYLLAIPIKREDKKLVGSLTRPEIDALIEAPDRSQWIGRRDHALLLTMYNSGARVSEMTMLKREQVSFGTTTFLEFTAKAARNGPSLCGPKHAVCCRSGFES